MKNQASAFYSPGPVFDVEKSDAQNMPTAKKIMQKIAHLPSTLSEK